jgi:hypothetical protein
MTKVRIEQPEEIPREVLALVVLHGLLAGRHQDDVMLDPRWYLDTAYLFADAMSDRRET